VPEASGAIPWMWGCHGSTEAGSKGCRQARGPFEMEISSTVLHASAIKFLEDGGEQEAADLLRECRVNAYASGDTWFVGDEVHEALHVEVVASRKAYKILTDGLNEITSLILNAIEATIPPLTYIKHFTKHGMQVGEHEALSIIYRTKSTSNASSVVEDIWLDPPPDRDEVRTRRIIRSELVDNIHSARARVKLCIAHQRRHSAKEPWEDVDAFNLATLKAGQEMKLALNADETLFLYDTLAHLHKLTENRIPDGECEFTLVDSTAAAVVKGRAAELIQAMTEQASEEFWDALEQIQPNLFRAVALTKLHEIRENAVKTFEEKLTSGDWDEGDWQTFFEDNTWIFGYGLRYQFLTTVVAQPNYGGTTVTGRGGQRGDFLTASEADLRFTVVVELKKPGSRLLETQLYRNKVYVLSKDLIGGVTQVQSNCRTWEIHGSQLPDNREQLESDEAPSYTTQPRGILIIGNLHELDNYAKRTTFELLRRNLQNPDVITFDELLARSKHLLLNEEHNLRPGTDAHGTSKSNDDEEIDF
jgi:hypothetical protein